MALICHSYRSIVHIRSPRTMSTHPHSTHPHSTHPHSTHPHSTHPLAHSYNLQQTQHNGFRCPSPPGCIGWLCIHIDTTHTRTHAHTRTRIHKPGPPRPPPPITASCPSSSSSSSKLTTERLACA